jgi:alkyldihydroxyacetonephosphate synthase
MRWWGWGEEGRSAALPAAVETLLERELGLPLDPGVARVALEEVRLPEPRLADGVRDRLLEALGAGNVLEDRLSRVTHAVGRSYPDLVRIRSGDASGAPDLVAYPGSREEVARVLAACAEGRVACVPFGGGTSVVGGVEPRAGGMNGAVSLDVARLDRLGDVDERSLTATLEAGATGPGAEEELARHGLTLGHFPQSFEYATIGGLVATRSAGQASTGHGRMDDLVLGLRLASPAGEVALRPGPASAAGPALAELVMGSEGVLGVITEVTLAVRRLPRARRYEAWSFSRFDAGLEAFRELAQGGRGPDVARLSDPEETRLSMALAGASGGGLASGVARRAGAVYLRARGHAAGCLAILGFEGEPADVARRRARSARLLRSGGGVPLGRRPGAAWRRGRFQAPYLRDDLLDRGVMAETLETAAGWSGLSDLHRRVGDALRDALAGRGTPPLVMCHVSHLYPSGASLYFTFLARQESGAELEQWRAAKEAASEAIVSAGATITHHHAVGSDHAPWMRSEVGELGLEVLRAAKDRLDPDGIMNPGKLLHDPPRLALPGEPAAEESA